MVTVREMLRRVRNLVTHRVSTLPILVLMPHEGCNSRCRTCDLWRPSRPGREVSREALERDLEVLRRWNVRRVVLSGGEALLHSNLWGLCELLSSLPAKITLLTNGLLLGRLARDVVRWCDEVIVSLDGTTPTHDELRGVRGATARMAAGIEAVKRLNPSLRITGRCVLQRGNFVELPAIVEEAHRIGLDRISFLAADVSTQAFNRAVPWDEERVAGIALDRSEVRRLGAILDDLVRERAHDFASGFIAESPARLRGLLQYYAALNGDREFPPVRCNAPWVSAVVEADGAVRPCFFHRSLGNLNERPLDAILNSPEAVAFRRSLDVNRDPICRRCVCTLNLGLRAPA